MHIVEHDATNKRFQIMDNGKLAAEMTYVTSSPQLYIIDHTFVDDAYRGQGLGDKLFSAMIHHARENSIKLMPLCPFAKGRFERHPEHADLLL
ncbi:GNAT family N-acetyltransferase [Paenibacillus faecalis]|uniref:GNAT family N-acetyltransferase n=1 Tax=Paenibacillus faecalis TaxID=2079532 RepID=UPI000D112B8F|nr:GNAT family N-acetyltransferase [Paenibacillus faecalis]